MYRDARNSDFGLPLLTAPRARRPSYLAEQQQPSRPIARSCQKVLHTLFELIASARAWSSRAGRGATGSRLAAGFRVGNRSCGRHGLPSTAQRAGMGTTRRRSPSPMEEERGCAPISPQGVLHTDGGTQDRVRSSHPPPSGATPGSRDINPMSQDARLVAGSFVRRGALRGPTPAMSRRG